MHRLAACTLGSLLVCTAHAAEIDSYTETDRFIWSAVPFINKTVNQRIDRVVENLNEEGTICSNHHQSDAAYEVYDEFAYTFIENVPNTLWGTLYVGHFVAEEFHIMAPDDQKINLPFEESIYRDYTYVDGPSLKAKGTLGITKAGGNFDLFGASYLGFDKLGHFFVEGRSYYYLAYLDEDEINIDEAVAWGVSTEEGKYGYVTTGVYSYADTATNFEGMRFWNQLLMLNPDPVDPDDKWHNQAYLGCAMGLDEDGDPVGRWSKTKTFDWNRYVNPAMDERINCNSYRNQHINDMVKGHITTSIKDAFWFMANEQCPIYPRRCRALEGKYGEWTGTIISPECRAEYE